MAAAKRRLPVLGAVSEGGIAADHRAHMDAPFLVAPTHAVGFNTLRPLLHPKACWRIDDLRFDFDSSFVLPTGADEFRLLAEKRPVASGDDPTNGLLLSVFGHADPTGQDDYNKVLSGRRASAVYAILVRDPDRWENLYSNGFGGDVWSLRHVQLMLIELGHDPGKPDGKLGAGTQNALREFQASSGLPQTGAADKPTRRELFLAYMDAICRDNSGLPFRYRPQDFLSRGKAGDGKADLQGCSEFNPILVFSENLAKEFQKAERKAERDSANVTNRRVVVFLFDSRLDIDSSLWPCPTVDEGIAGCRKRFWKDADTRRNPKGGQREYLKGGRTFACNFYDRLASSSPCEGARQALRIFVHDENGRRMPRAPYRLTAGPQVRESTASAEGAIIEQNLILGASCSLEWGLKDTSQGSTSDSGSTQFKFSREILLSTEPEADGDSHVDRQLNNLGFTELERDDNVSLFKLEYAMADVTTAEIDTAHREGTEKSLA